jgi:outer membrane protein OmpA-like peptidoglycan-associated protein
MHRSLLAIMVGLFLTNPLAAQQKGAWELGPFGRYNWYDKSFNQVEETKDKNSFGFGGRLGYFVADRWSLEVDGSANPTDLNTTSGPQSVGMVYMPFHLRALYNAPIGDRWSFLAGPGVAYNRYSVSDAADEFTSKKFEGSDWGVGGLAGLRYRFNDWLAARIDGTFDFIPSPKTGEITDPAAESSDDSNTMWGLQAGLSAFLGMKCTDKLDSIRVEPKNSEIFVGERVDLRVNGYLCDGRSVDVSNTSAARALAGGALAGLTFTGTQAGCFDVEASNATARKRGTDAARICVKERPRPAVTLDRCELVPSTATLYPGQTQEFRVMAYYSDGTSRDLSDALVTADGGRVTGRTYTAPAMGTYRVTAQCGGGRTATGTVTVRSVSLTLRALFQFDKAIVDDQAERDSLRWLAGQLQQFPTLSLTLYGHTDWVGSASYNEGLAMRRINAVVDTLAAYGVDRARMSAWTRTSFGECQPMADNRTRDGRAMNRRVEIFDTPSAKQYEGTARCANRP